MHCCFVGNHARNILKTTDIYKRLPYMLVRVHKFNMTIHVYMYSKYELSIIFNNPLQELTAIKVNDFTIVSQGIARFDSSVPREMRYCCMESVVNASMKMLNYEVTSISTSSVSECVILPSTSSAESLCKFPIISVSVGTSPL